MDHSVKPSARPTQADELLLRVGRGDADAFIALYESASPILFGICLRILPSRAQAEDALQDVFMTVWRRAATYDQSRGRAMTWLTTLARNGAIDRLRSDRVLLKSIDGERALQENLQIGAHAELEADEERRRLQDCLDLLEPASRVLIVTSFFDGATYSQLARQASLPLGTVKGRVRRALAKLRDCLE